MDLSPSLERSESTNACPVPPTPGGSKVPRANTSSTSGHGSADAEGIERTGLNRAEATTPETANGKRSMNNLRPHSFVLLQTPGGANRSPPPRPNQTNALRHARVRWSLSLCGDVTVLAR